MPRTVSHDARREEVGEAALRVIERQGFAGATVREIAREAGYTTGVVSHYFRDKRELLVHAYGLVVDRTAERVRRQAAEEGVAAGLAELLPLDPARRREAVIWHVLGTAGLGDPVLREELAARCERARETIRPVLRALLPVPAGGGDAADGPLVLVDGIAVNAILDPDRFPPARQLELLAEAL